MRKVQKKPATRSVAATRIANIRAEKIAHKKIIAQKKQATNIRARAKKALQQERPYTPRTEDANLKKIVADMSRSIIKKVDNADKKSDNATTTAEQWQKQTALLLVEHYNNGH